MLSPEDLKVLKPLVENLGIIMNKIMEEDPDIRSAIEKIKDAGFEIFIVNEMTFALRKIETEEAEVDPKVIDGEVEPNTFKEEDDAFLKKFHIKLD